MKAFNPRGDVGPREEEDVAGAASTPTADAVALQGCGVEDGWGHHEVTANNDKSGGVPRGAELGDQVEEPGWVEAGVVHT